MVRRPPADEGYRRALSNRQIQMIAVGGAIGVGLFLGSGKAIQQAGPGLIIGYAVAGAIIFLVMRALGELLLYRPVSGSFADYAEEFLGPFAGFVTGWAYWLMWVVTGMAEITAAGIYVKVWFPDVPQWLTAAVVLVLLYLANLISVRLFGEFEFWFSMIKVVTIVAAIVLGLAIILFDLGPAGDQASFTHLWDEGGLFPNGFGAALLALQIVMFAYLGVELVGVTAGEAKDPERVVPKAVNNIAVRIAVFYIGALFVLLALVPWTRFSGEKSPFVMVFAYIGIPAAASVINFVVLTAALSSCNSGLYSTGRMLRTLSRYGDAPRALGTLSSRQVPAAGITASAVVMALGVVVNAVVPEQAFAYITSVATACVLWVWAVILISHLRYRAAVRAGRLPASPFKMPGAPWTSVISLAFLALVVVLLAFSPDTRIALYVTVPVAVLLVIGYLAARRGTPADLETQASDQASG